MSDEPDFPEPPPPIDWEAKFQQQVSDNIRYKATASAKLDAAHLELDEARREIAALTAEVARLTPAGERLEKCVKERTRESIERTTQISGLREEIRKLKEHRSRGQRAVLEDVIGWLQQTADKMPELETVST